MIAIYSVKGGVGKTTLAANLAWCSAALFEHRTLLWDLDPAGGAGFLLSIGETDTSPADSIFFRRSDPANLIVSSDIDNLNVLPADESLRALDSHLLQLGKRRRLAKLTSGLARSYARIVMDCPPVLNEVSAQVMRAADLIIVPLPPSPLSTRALEVVVQEIDRIGKRRPPILPVLSMLDLRRSLHRNARDANPDWPIVPYSSTIEQCAVRKQPVGAFAAKSPAVQPFAQLWRAIESKLAEVSS